MMTKQKTILIAALFLLAITGIRLAWIYASDAPNYPTAVHGVLDLRNWNMERNRAIPLSGEWEFYPGVFVAPKTAATSGAGKTFVRIPEPLNPSLRPLQTPFGTYRLRILTGSDQQRIYRIHVADIKGASELFVNGVPLAHSGHPAAEKEQSVPRDVPYSASFTTDQSEIDMVIHAANFSDFGGGGIIKTIKFGMERAVYTETWLSTLLQVIVSVGLVIHALYACILYLLGIRQKELLYFVLLVIVAIFTVLVADDKLLFVWLPIHQDWILKISTLAYIWAAALLLEFTLSLLSEYQKLNRFHWYTILCAAVTLFILLASTESITQAGPLFMIVTLFPFLAVLTATLRTTLKGEKDAIFLLLAVICITMNIIWGAMGRRGGMQLNFYPVDMMISFLTFATYWFKRYFRTADAAVELAGKLQKADKLRDDFLTNTSHELRNPLHGMLNIAQTVLDSNDRALDAKNRRNMQLLMTVGRRMSLMLNDLLDFTRLKESGIRLKRSSLRIQTLATGVFQMLRFMTEGKSIDFINHIPDDFPPVLADENRLIQILFNLLHNAVKFTEKGSIRIHAEAKEGMAYIHVEDTGVGMDEEMQRRIFHPYEQGDHNSGTVGGGIGLGLSICKQFVELHGGTIQVRSHPKQGSQFTFTLPLADSSDSSAQPSETEWMPPMFTASDETAAAVFSDRAADESADSFIENGADRPRILAVDDDPVNLNVLIHVLSPERYDIVTATSGAEALSLLDAKQWDLIICDVMMPHMSGYELTRIVRDRFSAFQLPILLLTARTRAEDIETGFLSGANDYVTKPMEARELKSRVRVLTELRRSVSEQLRMEAAWLQAQIQPHFIFNTLNAVAALSLVDLERMRKLLKVFGDYLQASFDFQNSQQLVPLQHELDLVHSYLFIEKERFADKLNVTWEVDKDIQLQIPPLSIQPLVENAVRHGILGRVQGGNLLIRITSRADYTEIVVKDDGVGINEETLRQIFDKSPNVQAGVGLRNTHLRLKQLYGKGLQIESVPGRGTTISFAIANDRTKP